MCSPCLATVGTVVKSNALLISLKRIARFPQPTIIPLCTKWQTDLSKLLRTFNSSERRNKPPLYGNSQLTLAITKRQTSMTSSLRCVTAYGQNLALNL